MVTFYNGNILDSGADIICHQVNCQGAMNSGVAKAIRQKWPKVYTEYKAKCDYEEATVNDLYGQYENPIDWSECLLGDIQVVLVEENKAVINMFAQQYYGYDKKRYTSYDAFWNCINLIKQSVPTDKKIGFPYNIGCGLGGANWNVILTMIDTVLADYTVEIYVLEDKDGKN
jgi:O-acetyl-ADP-ribose deacetylase (regulator of RNase III)